jgi:acyl-CoA synthetase (AMP-forming)/AMP-acid ligase II
MRRFDAEDALRTIARHRCTTTFMAPTLLKRLVDLPAAVARATTSRRCAPSWWRGARAPMRVKEEILAWFGPVLYEFYGSTELGVNTVLGAPDMLRKPHSCGRAARASSWRSSTTPAGRGRPASPASCTYAATRECSRATTRTPRRPARPARGEWLSVGDVAWIDAEGFVYICDRKRDMIISGGVNIYPAEIEDVLHRHPAVEDAAVFGVPDTEWGERVHAALLLRPGAVLTDAEVRAFCRQHLADYKTPREVSFHAEFPRDSAGKLVKRLLRDPHWTGRTTRV